jgi:hypothetical protein
MVTHAPGLFCGYGRSHINGQLANLWLHEGSHHRHSKDNVRADRLSLHYARSRACSAYFGSLREFLSMLSPERHGDLLFDGADWRLCH